MPFLSPAVSELGNKRIGDWKVVMILIFSDDARRRHHFLPVLFGGTQQEGNVGPKLSL